MNNVIESATSRADVGVKMQLRKYIVSNMWKNREEIKINVETKYVFVFLNVKPILKNQY